MQKYDVLDIEEKAPAQSAAKLSLFVEFVFLAIGGYFAYIMFTYNILPMLHRLIVLGGLAPIALIFLVLIIRSWRKPLMSWVVLVFAVLYLALNAFAMVQAQNTLSTLNVLSKGAETTKIRTNVSLMVLKDSQIKEERALKGVPVASAYPSDAKCIEEFYAQFEAKNHFQLTIMPEKNYAACMKALFEKSAEVIAINENYLPMLKDQYPKLDEETRVLATYTVETELTVVDRTQTGDKAKQPAPALPNKNAKAFQIYISGIDTAGSLDNVSRSDVNILMTVNPSTKQISLLSIPRDTYVSIPGDGDDGMDKLTHAGIYGVNTSKAAVEGLLQQNIDYWLRVNFTSVEEIVDLLGGVSVSNPVAFSSAGYSFDEGNINLNGREALTFCRERYSLGEGDLARGKNQERVLAAIIDKLSGAELLRNFPSFLSVAQEYIQTSMSTNDMMGVVNAQLATPGKWKISNLSITGHGEMGLPSYAMPGYELYMFVPDEASVAAATKAINDLLVAH